ncbi:unnamed protein product, partial [Mesorhabditis belari]|uniref:Uncharacterized protein n=1 Tax=Mesorhabditis belari TaxID=2138241 RepID=A0AAF3EPW9_9BILA
MLTLFLSFILAVGVMFYYAEQDRIQEEMARQTREVIEKKTRSGSDELKTAVPTPTPQQSESVAMKIGKNGETQLRSVEAKENNEKTAISTTIAPHSSRALSRPELRQRISSDVAAYLHKTFDKFCQVGAILFLKNR